jgi:hypothetical protein
MNAGIDQMPNPIKEFDSILSKFIADGVYRKPLLNGNAQYG